MNPILQARGLRIGMLLVSEPPFSSYALMAWTNLWMPMAFIGILGKRSHQPTGSLICSKSSLNAAQAAVAGTCWLTEWGLPVSSGSSCPVIDDKRTAIFYELRDDFSQFVQQGRLKGIIFYAWQGNIHEEGSYNAFLCGSLTKSGRLAIAPM